MAEYVMKDLVKKARPEDRFQIALEATNREELDNPVYPPAQRKLVKHDIACGDHAARQLRNHDCEECDLLIGMDQANFRNMYRIHGGDFNDKMHFLMGYVGHPNQEIAASWYTNDFDTARRDILVGCQGLFRELTGYLSNDILA